MKRQVLRSHENQKSERINKNTENVRKESSQSRKVKILPRTKNQDRFVSYSALDDKMDSTPFSRFRNENNKIEEKVQSPTIPFVTTSSSPQTSVTSTIPTRNTFKGFTTEEIQAKEFKPVEGNSIILYTYKNVVYCE